MGPAPRLQPAAPRWGAARSARLRLAAPRVRTPQSTDVAPSRPAGRPTPTRARPERDPVDDVVVVVARCLPGEVPLDALLREPDRREARPRVVSAPARGGPRPSPSRWPSPTGVSPRPLHAERDDPALYVRVVLPPRGSRRPRTLWPDACRKERTPRQNQCVGARRARRSGRSRSAAREGRPASAPTASSSILDGVSPCDLSARDVASPAAELPENAILTSFSAKSWRRTWSRGSGTP